MTGCEIAEKLRRLNRWRRGDDETLLMPDPAAIGRWIDAAADALELRDNRAARVAELEAALRAILGPYADDGDALAKIAHAEDVLARAESTTPDKHPDTEIVDWLEDNTAVPYCAGLYDSSPDAAVEIPGIGVFVGGTLRAAIDAARKALAESTAPKEVLP